MEEANDKRIHDQTGGYIDNGGLWKGAIEAGKWQANYEAKAKSR